MGKYSRVLGVLFAFCLIGCSSGSPEPIQTATTVVVTVGPVLTVSPTSRNTPKPEPTATLEPSSTLAPSPTTAPSATPEPTLAPTPNPTPSPVAVLDYVGPIPENALARLGKGSVDKISYIADGRFLVLSTKNGPYLYDAETLEELWYGCCEAISSALAPAGDMIAAGTSSGEVVLWSLPDGQEIRRIQAVDDPNSWLDESIVTGVAFDSSGTQLATSTADGKIKLWDLASGEKLQTMQDDGGNARSLRFSPEGGLLGVASGKNIVLWDTESGQIVQTLPQEEWVVSFEFSPDTGLVATFSGQDVFLWDRESGQLVNTLEQDADVWSLAFSPQGLLAVGLPDKIAIWDTDTGEMATSMTGNLGLIRAVTFSMDGDVLVSSGDQTTFWNMADGSPMRVWEGHMYGIIDLDFSPDGSALAFSTYPSRVFVWNVAEEQPVQVLGGYGLIDNMELFSDGDQLAFSSDNAAVLADMATGQELQTLPHDDQVAALAVSPDGNLLATAAANVLKLWNAADGEEAGTVEYDEAIHALAISPDGKQLAVGLDSRVDMLVLLTLEQAFIIETDPDWEVESLVFSPDGTSLAALAGNITLWDTQSAEMITESNLYPNGHSISFSADGRFIGISPELGITTVWDIENDTYTTLEGHSLNFSGSADFSPVDNVLATRGSDGTIVLWEIGPQD